MVTETDLLGTPIAALNKIISDLAGFSGILPVQCIRWFSGSFIFLSDDYDFHTLFSLFSNMFSKIQYSSVLDMIYPGYRTEEIDTTNIQMYDFYFNLNNKKQ